MSRFTGHTNGPWVRRRALNMVEVAIAMVLISTVLLAAMNMVGAVGASRRSMTDRAAGALLAEQLMSEVLQQAYEDPDESPGSFGIEGFESVTKNRIFYDDVDDYDRWNKSPPQYSDGAVVPGYTGWRRMVQVKWVDPADTSLIMDSNTGVKCVNIIVTRNKVKVAELLAIRTDVGELE